MLWCTTADRQERDWEGRKFQENTRKKGHERQDCKNGTTSALHASPAIKK
uniref:Uncharacterized protein n=1 Tax=Rhizophagus irregularis (strain DAOM 181602 / DAOM 197198 / MUCL 43194) TaxID=747089 RepID=U9SU86_RHIID